MHVWSFGCAVCAGALPLPNSGRWWTTPQELPANGLDRGRRGRTASGRSVRRRTGWAPIRRLSLIVCAG